MNNRAQVLACQILPAILKIGHNARLRAPMDKTPLNPRRFVRPAGPNPRSR